MSVNNSQLLVPKKINFFVIPREEVALPVGLFKQHVKPAL